jgi:hypothetical protein
MKTLVAAAVLDAGTVLPIKNGTMKTAGVHAKTSLRQEGADRVSSGTVIPVPVNAELQNLKAAALVQVNGTQTHVVVNVIRLPHQADAREQESSGVTHTVNVSVVDLLLQEDVELNSGIRKHVAVRAILAKRRRTVLAARAGMKIPVPVNAH